MDEEEMVKLLRSGMSPLEVSIKKWEDIVNRKGEDRSGINCALCYTAKDDKCGAMRGYIGSCIIAESVKAIGCQDTPYTAWSVHTYTVHGDIKKRVRCTTCAELAQEELDFIKSLRGKLCGEEW